MAVIPLLAAFTAGFALAAGYAIYRVRQLRAVVRHNVDAAFKLAVKRADCWSRFCDDCKQIAAPWWKP